MDNVGKGLDIIAQPFTRGSETKWKNINISNSYKKLYRVFQQEMPLSGKCKISVRTRYFSCNLKFKQTVIFSHNSGWEKKKNCQLIGGLFKK